MIDDALELILLDDIANDDKAFISDESSGCGGIFIACLLILAIMILIGIFI